MSIATRTGDHGETGLMYNRRVPKNSPRVEAYGTVDELSAALGMAKVLSTDAPVREEITAVQRELISLMGELAVADEDFQKYQDSQYPLLADETLARLDRNVAALEAQNIRFAGWATPGATPAAAALDVARTICRRAERRIVAVRTRPLVVQYINRLADFLWLLARKAEQPAS